MYSIYSNYFNYYQNTNIFYAFQISLDNVISIYQCLKPYFVFVN